jgi:hypothetical protein
LEEVLSDEGLETGSLTPPQAVEKEVKRLLYRVVPPEQAEGQRFFEARSRSAQGTLSRVRSVGADTLYVANLPLDTYAELRSQWRADWENANRPWGRLDGTALWRCGGAIFCVGREHLEGQAVPR